MSKFLTRVGVQPLLFIVALMFLAGGLVACNEEGIVDGANHGDPCMSCGLEVVEVTLPIREQCKDGSWEVDCDEDDDD